MGHAAETARPAWEPEGKKTAEVKRKSGNGRKSGNRKRKGPFTGPVDSGTSLFRKTAGVAYCLLQIRPGTSVFLPPHR